MIQLRVAAFSSALLMATCQNATSSGQGGKVIQAKPGQEVRAAVIGSPRPDCTVAPRPEVRVVSPANGGLLRIGPRTLRTSRVKDCPPLEIPVTAVFYISRPNFTGTDRFTIEAKSHDRLSENLTFIVEVGQ